MTKRRLQHILMSANSDANAVKITILSWMNILFRSWNSYFSALNCSKIIVNSGYRRTAHDKNVGGSGVGQHVNGTAADIVCYDKSGKKISSKVVCCAAQDIGFGGIANIDSTYTAAHVDVRSSNFWKGDETVTTVDSVCSDFYSHYKLSKSDVYGSSAKRTKSVTLTIDGVTYEGTLMEK